MTIVRTTRAAPATEADNSLITASITIPTGQLCIVCGWQLTDGDSEAFPTSLGAGISGITFTQIVDHYVVGDFNKSMHACMWKGVGAGTAGQFTVSSSWAGSIVTAIRAYSFSGASTTDPDNDGTSIDENLVEWDFEFNPDTIVAGTDGPTDSNTLNMMWGCSIEDLEVDLDVFSGWTQVETFDTVSGGGSGHGGAAGVSGTITVGERLGSITTYGQSMPGGDDHITVLMGVGIRDDLNLRAWRNKVRKSRAAKMTAYRF